MIHEIKATLNNFRFKIFSYLKSPSVVFLNYTMNYKSFDYQEAIGSLECHIFEPRFALYCADQLRYIARKHRKLDQRHLNSIYSDLLQTKIESNDEKKCLNLFQALKYSDTVTLSFEPVVQAIECLREFRSYVGRNISHFG